MRWLRKAFGRRFAPVPALRGDGAFALPVTGDGLYQAPLAEVAAALAAGSVEAPARDTRHDTAPGPARDLTRTLDPAATPAAPAGEARLVHERDNPYDPGAVRVEILGRKVGYLRPDLARDLLALDLPAPPRGPRAARCRARVVRRPGETPDDVALLRVRLDLALPLAEERPAPPAAHQARRAAFRRWSGAHREPPAEGAALPRQVGSRRRPG